jgi:hypothetical protein
MSFQRSTSHAFADARAASRSGSPTGSPINRRRGLWRRSRHDGDEATPGPLGSASSGSTIGRLAMLGVALAAGALIGASIALLYAPESGARTRMRLRRRVRRVSRGAQNVWDDAGDLVRLARS